MMEETTLARIDSQIKLVNSIYNTFERDGRKRIVLGRNGYKVYYTAWYYAGIRAPQNLGHFDLNYAHDVKRLEDLVETCLLDALF